MGKINSEPIRFLVNTHVHPDHTAGNASFDPAKLRVDGEIVDLIPIRAAHTSAGRFIRMVYSQLKSGQ